MTRGRVGRGPAIVAMLKRAKRPMSSHEIAALFRDTGDDTANHKTIGETLRNLVKTKPDIGIVRHDRMRGFYVYVPTLDVDVSTGRKRSDDVTARVTKRVVAAKTTRETTNLNRVRAGAIEAMDEAAQRGKRSVQWPTNDAITSGDPALKDAQVVLPSGVGPNEPIDYARTSKTWDELVEVDNPLQPKVTMDTSWASAHPFPFTHIRIVRTLADGRVLFTDDPTGKAWVAKEV